MEGSSAPRGLIKSSQNAAVHLHPAPVLQASPGEQARRGLSTQSLSFAPAESPVSTGMYARQGKRVFDIAFALVFMATLGFWLLPFIALIVRLDSRGPALFRQARVGMNGELFTCLKFRTMTHNPDAQFIQAQKNDCRITRVGKVLRKTNLDELPQFINVLLGDMSIVGPRPHVPELDRLFGDLVPGYTSRTATRPGVTGLAQVSGCRGETRSVREMTHRIRFDLFYAKNMGFWLDLKIIVATVWCAIAGDQKAY